MRYQELKSLIIDNRENENLIKQLKIHIKYSPLNLNTKEIVDLKNVTVDKSIWSLICKYTTFDEIIIENYLLDVVDWHNISIYQNLSLGFINKYIDKVDLKMIGKYQNISFDFVKSHIDYMNLSIICQNKLIDMVEFEKIIDYYQDDSRIDWFEVSSRKLSTEFIKKFKDRLFISLILIQRNYDNQFVLELSDEIHKVKEILDDREISLEQLCVECFIEYKCFELNKLNSFKNNINNILKKYKLSESFLARHIDKFDPYYIVRYQDISNDFIQKYINI